MPFSRVLGRIGSLQVLLDGLDPIKEMRRAEGMIDECDFLVRLRLARLEEGEEDEGLLILRD